MNKVLKYILDFIFPIECVGCGDEGKWLCDYCFSKIEFNKKQICPLCGQIFKLGYSCVCTVSNQENKKTTCLRRQEKQKNKNKLEIRNLKLEIGSVDVYITFVDLKKNPQILKLIHKLKYGFAQGAAEDLARIGAEFLKKNKVWEKLGGYESGEIIYGAEGEDAKEGKEWGGKLVFIPVPLHRRRLLWRGFNQSDLILREMEREWKEGEEGREGEEGGGLEIRNSRPPEAFGRVKFEICNDILVRKKNTFFQGKTKMKEKDRILNMREAFEAQISNYSNLVQHPPACAGRSNHSHSAVAPAKKAGRQGKLYRGELGQEGICGKTVVLFDDVITSGATVEECARALKKTGVARVIAMAVGKG